MPSGTRHELVGLLLRSPAEVVLEVPGGGTWRLDLGWRTARRALGLVGLRIRVTGIRDGFDLLAVDEIERT